MRIPFICANWKMYKTVDEAVKYVKEFRAAAKDLDGVEIVLAPSFVALHSSVEAARNSNIGIGAQDLFWEREGAFTGEVSGPMLREAGVEYVIVGHSERRALFGETDAIVNRKITAAFAFGLCPIACIGETLDQRERHETFEVLDRQIKVGLDGLTSERIAQLVIAYEPVWAIGTGRNATPGASRRGARTHPEAPASVVRPRFGRAVSRHLRGQREARQHHGPHVAARCGRRARWRGQSRRANLPWDRQSRPAGVPRPPDPGRSGGGCIMRFSRSRFI